MENEELEEDEAEEALQEFGEEEPEDMSGASYLSGTENSGRER